VIKYVSRKDITDQQEKVMLFIINWVKTKKTPVPKMQIMKQMVKSGMVSDTVEWSLGVLLAKGYLRRAWTNKQNTTSYVQLRTLWL